MKTPKLSVAMGHIDDDLISGAIDYIPPKRKTIIYYWKYVVAVSVCIAVVLGINIYLKQYVFSNDVQVQYENAGDSSYCEDVTPEMAGKSAKANNIHNLLVTKKLEWYSNCYYDYDSNVVKIGLTENTEENQQELFKIIDETFEIGGETDIQFYECEFPYQHLKESYDNLESRQWLLRIIGVKRYNISIIDNCVNVYITSGKNYFAIFVVNKLTDEDDAIQFKILCESAMSSDGMNSGVIEIKSN